MRDRLMQLPVTAEPPFDFDELQRRGAARIAAQSSRRRSSVRIAGMAAAISGVLLGAALWQQLLPNAVAPEQMASMNGEPALVRVDTRAAAGDLEDRIAVVDDLLSESRIQGQSEGLAALERNRSQLMTSLQKVRYAEDLMNQ